MLRQMATGLYHVLSALVEKKWPNTRVRYWVDSDSGIDDRYVNPMLDVALRS